MFPQLEGIRFTHAWGGPIDQTPTFVPFYRTLAAGQHPRRARVQRARADRRRSSAGTSSPRPCSDETDEWTTLAVNRPESAFAPPEPFRYPLVRAAAFALERGDMREDAGKARGPLYRLVGEAPVRYRERVVRRGAPAQ